MSITRSVPPSTASTFPPGTSEEAVKAACAVVVAESRVRLENIAKLAREVQKQSGEFSLNLPKDLK